jgi:hypothetical protein
MSCICGIRPGTICSIRDYPDECLRWEDVKIRRGVGKGMFNVQIVFKYLIGNRDELNVEHFRQLEINPPTYVEHLPMPLAYGLLVIVLRRDILKARRNFESLLNGEEYNMMNTENALKDPFYTKCWPQGMASIQ